MFSRLRILLYILLLPGLSGMMAQSLKPEDLAKVKSAMAYIRIRHKTMVLDAEVTISGSGFFISRNGYLVTNYHVVQNIVSGYDLSFPTTLDEIKVIQRSGSSEYRSHKAYVYAVDKEHDLAILALYDTATVPFLNIDTAIKLSETMPLWAFGYPYGESFTVLQRGPELTVTKGSLSALRHNDKNELEKIQLDATVNPGNSGGPVVNEKGEVIGVVNMGGGKTQINFAVPVLYVARLLKQNPPGKGAAPKSKLSIISNPSGAKIFINGEEKGTSPLNNVEVDPGWQTVCAVKDGYKVCVKQSTLGGSDNISLRLEQQKKHLLNYGTGKKRDTKPVGDAVMKMMFPPESNGKGALFDEGFGDQKKFEKWEQSTGGTGTRTWYLEDGMLQQFENDGLLHAIYLGDSAWSDYIVKARMKIKGKEGDPRAGIIFRETADGFYLFRIHAESNKAQLAYHCKQPFGWNVVNEKELPMDVKTGEWYTLRVLASGNSIICFLDSMLVFNEQAGFSPGGRIGFYSVESNPMFDDLRVTKAGAFPEKQNSESGDLVSFWFTDYFNAESNWWYTSSGDARTPGAWIVSDAGFVQPDDDARTRYCDFTRYDLVDFAMVLALTFGKSSDGTEFGINFRKNPSGHLSLVFSASEKKVKLIHYTADMKSKVLKSENITEDFFTRTQVISLKVSGQEVLCSTGSGSDLLYKGKLPFASGSFGLACRHLPLVLHEMRVTSPR